MADTDLTNMSGIPAVVEWTGIDAQPRFLFAHTKDPSRRVTFEVQYNAASRAALFKIRVPIGLKAAGYAKTPLSIYIHSNILTSLECDVPEAAPDVVRSSLGGPRRFQFSLAQPADLIVPLVSLAPQNKGHGDMLDSLKLLAQETRFSVYIPQKHLTDASERFVRPLSEAIATQTIGFLQSAADLRGLYGGAGGKVLAGAELCGPVLNTAPPSYDELAPAPPGPEAASGKSGVFVCRSPTVANISPGSTSKHSGSSKKRRRGSTSTASTASNPPQIYEPDVVAICKKLIDEALSRDRQVFTQELRELKSTILEHVDQRLEEFEGKWCSIDDVDEHVTRHVSSFEDLIEVKIEDHVAGIRMELEEFVDGQVANTQDRVLQRVRDASWTVAIDDDE